MIRVLCLALYGSKAASHRVRFGQFKNGLAELGIDLIIEPLLDNDYIERTFSGKRPSLRSLTKAYINRIKRLTDTDSFELAIVYAELLPLAPYCLEKQLLRLPFIYDIDDSFYLKYRTGRLGLMSPILAPKVDKLMSSAVAVTAGNKHLAAYASKFNNSVRVMPSVVNTTHFLPSALPKPDNHGMLFTIGWIGSPSTAQYLELLIEPLERLASERPVRLHVIGASAPFIKGVDIVETQWNATEEVSCIQQFDVGVMPLTDCEWTRGKCAFKLIQYMACGIPVVASRVGANIDAVPLECGILVESADQWLNAFRKLASDYALRQRLGAAARQHVTENLSLKKELPIYASLIYSVLPNQSDLETVF